MLENFKPNKQPPPPNISFSFTPKEIEVLLKKGMTPDEIREKERVALNKIAQADSIKH